MKDKLKQILKSGRVIVLLVFLLIAIYSIRPTPWADGVAIRTVDLNSSASIAGIESPKPNTLPMSRERITAIELDQKKHSITSLKEYYDLVNDLELNKTFFVYTNKNTYVMQTLPITETITLAELEDKEVPLTREISEEINGTTVTRTEYVTKNITRIINETFFDPQTAEPFTVSKEVTEVVNLTTTIKVNKTQTTILGVKDIGLTVYEAPKNNLRLGLDLQGGTRVILEPEDALTEQDMEILKLNMERRLNVYGLSDIIIRVVRDKPVLLGGTPKYILVEIPGANEDEVKDLLSKQGKFEAKIKNVTVFKGGQDITYVCRSADCSGIDPNRGCGTVQGGWQCQFSFSITITPESAQRQADVTRDIPVQGSGQNAYLTEQIIFYLDDEQVDRLNIGESLKGRPVTDIQISGGGSGRTQQEAIFNALDNMKSLQTILITGSLPVKLNIVKTDNVSPILGKQFIRNTILVGLLALVGVSLIILFAYRTPKIVIPMVLILLSETILLLGLAGFIGWNLDLAAIAGIIIAVGTGVDNLIVISDETLSGRGERLSSWKDKIKNAFFIITVAYFTNLVAMLPLMFAGAGLLKGFAFTTIAGITFGVFIARPAFAKIIEILLKE